MKEHTLKEVQETLDRLGAQLRFMPTAEAKYLTGETTPRLWTAVLRLDSGRTVVTGQGETMDEAWERACARATEVRRFG
jgi:hypothetical protein